MIKTIKPLQVQQTTLEDLVIGSIVPEGIVVGKSRNEYLTPAGSFWLEENDKVPVFCIITKEMVEDTLTAMRER